MKLHCSQILFALTVVLITSTAVAANGDQTDDIKQMQGISIKADKEAPKSLYIVPWHKAEHKQNTSLSTSLVEKEMQAIDQDSFMQQLRLYELSKSDWYSLTPEIP